MTVIAWWRSANTTPGVLIPIDMGTDPLTGLARVLADEDVVTLIMRNGNAAVPAAQVRATTVVSRGTAGDIENDPPSVWFKPEDGDFDEDGTYEVVLDRTDEEGDVETFPDRVATSYQFLIGAKPGDEDA